MNTLQRDAKQTLLQNTQTFSTVLISWNPLVSYPLFWQPPESFRPPGRFPIETRAHATGAPVRVLLRDRKWSHPASRKERRDRSQKRRRKPRETAPKPVVRGRAGDWKADTQASCSFQGVSLPFCVLRFEKKQEKEEKTKGRRTRSQQRAVHFDRVSWPRNHTRTVISRQLWLTFSYLRKFLFCRAPAERLMRILFGGVV